MWTYKIVCCALTLAMFSIGFSACQSREEKDRAVVNQLIVAVEKNDTDRIIEAREKTLAMGERAIPFMIEAMPRASGVLKSEIAYLVGKAGEKAVPVMVELLAKEPPPLQLELLNLFENLKNPKAIEALESFLSTLSKGHELEFPCAKTLTRLGSDRGFMTLNEMLVTGTRSDKSRITVLYSELMDKRTLPGLLYELEHELDGEIKLNVIETIGKLRVRDTVPLLEKYALKHPTAILIRRSAAEAIATITGENCSYVGEQGSTLIMTPKGQILMQ
jgi:HEAT repeat protein